MDEYLRMIAGKTAALVGASVAIGAHIGGARPAQVQALQRFGQEIGLAFQIQDDVLGIWGDPAVTGKAAGNDVLRKKKSLPILHALNHPAAGAQFGAMLAGGMDAASCRRHWHYSTPLGRAQYAVAAAESHYAAGMAALEEALGGRTASNGLRAVAEWLLQRNA